MSKILIDEALRLADYLELAFDHTDGLKQAAAELRRLHAENQALRQLLEAEPVQELVAWRSIETAPKDGTKILGWSEEFGVRETQMNFYGEGSLGFAAWKSGKGPKESGWNWSEPKSNWGHTWKPTHWMPLSTPSHATPPAQPAPVQEPVAWVRWEMGSDGKLKQIDLPVDLPLATTPPASKQGPVSALTNLRVPIERINEIQGQLMAYYSSGAQAPKDLLFAASDCIGALAFDLIDAKRAAQPTDLNLNCKSVQARLATQWGYVKAEAAPKQCWKCGDMDAQFQAKCTVPYCAMKELP